LAKAAAQEASGQSFNSEQASNPRVMESPSAAIVAGVVSHVGVGLTVAFAVVFGAAWRVVAGELPFGDAPAEQPTSRAVAATAVVRTRRIDGSPLGDRVTYR
jgi:hypothetical protein